MLNRILFIGVQPRLPRDTGDAFGAGDHGSRLREGRTTTRRASSHFVFRTLYFVYCVYFFFFCLVFFSSHRSPITRRAAYVRLYFSPRLFCVQTSTTSSRLKSMTNSWSALRARGPPIRIYIHAALRSEPPRRNPSFSITISRVRVRAGDFVVVVVDVLFIVNRVSLPRAQLHSSAARPPRDHSPNPHDSPVLFVRQFFFFVYFFRLCTSYLIFIIFTSPRPPSSTRRGRRAAVIIVRV